jgi:hypothetical protein
MGWLWFTWLLKIRVVLALIGSRFVNKGRALCLPVAMPIIPAGYHIVRIILRGSPGRQTQFPR